jgi:hypothetical protein
MARVQQSNGGEEAYGEEKNGGAESGRLDGVLKLSWFLMWRRIQVGDA